MNETLIILQDASSLDGAPLAQFHTTAVPHKGQTVHFYVDAPLIHMIHKGQPILIQGTVKDIVVGYQQMQHVVGSIVTVYLNRPHVERKP